jgi:uncharacterized membrane protein YphA (DoxX/SURF4 family)
VPTTSTTATPTEPARATGWVALVSTLARLGLAVVWLVSGAIKAADPEQTWVAVNAYHVLPAQAVELVAAGLPWFELALGVLLLLGAAVRPVAMLAGLLLLAFIAGVSQAWARGLYIDFGCFGGGGDVAPEQTRYGTELLRDAGFLALAMWLVFCPRTRFALDRVLARRAPDPAA